MCTPKQWLTQQAPDAEWRPRIAAIQERAAAEDAGSEQRNGFKVLRKGPKRAKTSAIPDVHTFYANEASDANPREMTTH